MNEVAARANLTVKYLVVDSFPAAGRALLSGKADVIPNTGIVAARMEK